MQEPINTDVSHTHFRKHSLLTALILLFLSPVVSGQTAPNRVITFPEPGPMFTDSVFLSDSNRLALSDYGYQGCGIYSFSDQELVKSYDNSGSKYQSFAISPDETKIAFGYGGYYFARIFLRGFPSGRWIWSERYTPNVTSSSSPSPVWSVTFSPDSTRLFLTAGFSEGYLIDARDGRLINALNMTGIPSYNRPLECKFFPDGRRVFAMRHYDGIGRATIYDTETGEELWNVEGPETGGITGDGKCAVLHYSNEGVIRIFDLERGGEPKVYDCADPIAQVLSDGKNVVTANGRLGGLRQLNFDASKGRGTCAQVRSYQLPDQKEVSSSENEIPIAQARFSPDGKKLMFLTRPAVYVWDTSDLPSAIHETAKYKN